MKSLFVVLAMVFSSVSTFAGTCYLHTPVPATSDLFHGLELKNVVLDDTPKFLAEENYDPAKDSLSLRFFNIAWNGHETGFLGSRLSIVGKKGSLGFSDNYTGNFRFQGGARESNGVTTITAKEGSFYTEPQHAKTEAITQSSVTISNGKIIAVNLMYPIFKVWKVEDGVRYVAFTGEHQAVCVKSAQ